MTRRPRKRKLNSHIYKWELIWPSQTYIQEPRCTSRGKTRERGWKGHEQEEELLLLVLVLAEAVQGKGHKEQRLERLLLARICEI